MKQKNTVVTLALVGVLALAALAGGLLPEGNPVHAEPPDFGSGPFTRSVPENTPPGVNIGDPISATDPDETGDAAIEFGNTLTYKLGGTDAASFDIDPSTGQLITKAPLDYEDASNRSYAVVVTVDDGEDRDSPITQSVTINVTDEDEPPLAPYAPTVVSGEDVDDGDPDDESTTSLKVVWHPPENMGTDITDYNVQYKKSTETAFTDPNHDGTATTLTIRDLEVDTSYDVRVQATGEDTGPGRWWGPALLTRMATARRS